MIGGIVGVSHGCEPRAYREEHWSEEYSVPYYWNTVTKDY